MDQKQARENMLTAIFSALSLQHRRQVLTILMSGELGARDLRFNVVVSEPVLYGYLRTLQDAGLIKSRREGKTSYYSIATPRLRPLLLMALELADEVLATKAQHSEIDVEGLGESEV